MFRTRILANHRALGASTRPLFTPRALTKIVATIGPVSEQYPVLRQCVDAGLTVMRMNFSHATFEEANLRMTNLRKSPGHHTAKLGAKFNTRAVMLDTRGPEIRTGWLRLAKETGNKRATVTLSKGNTVTLTCDANSDAVQNSDDKLIYVDYSLLGETIRPGSAVLLDDGAIKLEVTEINDKTVECKVLNTGSLGERKGVNLPDTEVKLPPMSVKDKQDIAFGAKNDIDFIAASFIRRASDVEEIREFVTQEQRKHFPEDHPIPLIISKIESTEGLTNFDEILQVSDGIMVARGDLGVEIPLERVAVEQMKMVKKCRAVGKPVIVATQMLETMIKKPRPTRAEVADVTYAVAAGADAVMLSGESANGDYPVESIRTMKSIISETERSGMVPSPLSLSVETAECPHDATAAAAVLVAQRTKAVALVVHCDSAEAVGSVSKHLPAVPIVVVCHTPKRARQVGLLRGVKPVLVDKVSSDSHDALVAAQRLGHIKKGQLVVLVERGSDGDLVVGARTVPE